MSANTTVEKKDESCFIMPLQWIGSLDSIVTGTVGIVLNFILLSLILKRTSEDLKVYSRVLIQNCLLDIFLTTVVMVTRTEIDFEDGTIILMMRGPLQQLPHPYNHYMITVYVIALFSCVMFLPVQFIFRYYLVCRGKILSALQYSLLVCTCLGCALLYAVIHTHLFWPTPERIARSTYIVDHPFWHVDGHLPIFIATSVTQISVALMVLCCSGMSFVSYVIVIICNSLIYNKLRVLKTSMSEKARKAHSELTKVLQYQAMVPFFTCLVPIGLIVVFAIFGIHTCGRGVLMSILVSFIPVLNPLSAIIFVHQYKETVLAIFNAVVQCRRPRVTPLSTLSSHNGTKETNLAAIVA